MLHNAAFHQGLHCLLKTKMIFREQFYLEIFTCDPLNYTIEHSKFIAHIQKEEFISSFKSSAKAKSELHEYDKTPNLVNFMLLSITELYLQQILQFHAESTSVIISSMKFSFSNLY